MSICSNVVRCICQLPNMIFKKTFLSNDVRCIGQLQNIILKIDFFSETLQYYMSTLYFQEKTFGKV